MMRRDVSTCLIALLIAGFSVSLVYAHSGLGTIAVKAFGPVELDGDLAEWERFEAEVVVVDPFNLPEGSKFPPDQRIGPADITDNGKDWIGRFFIMWDDQNFYFAGDVTDDKVVPVNIQVQVEEQPYEADAVALCLDVLHDSEEGVGGVDGNFGADDWLFYLLILDTHGVAQSRAWNQDPWGAKDPQPDAKVVSKLHATGYTFEFSLSWDGLATKYRPKEGDVIGYEPGIYENDNDDMLRDAKVVWSATVNQHRNPWEWGDATLGESRAVEPGGKLAITWGKIKRDN